MCVCVNVWVWAQLVQAHSLCWISRMLLSAEWHGGNSESILCEVCSCFLMLPVRGKSNVCTWKFRIYSKIHAWNLSLRHGFKGIVHLEITILSSFTHYSKTVWISFSQKEILWGLCWSLLSVKLQWKDTEAWKFYLGCKQIIKVS